MVDDEPAMRFMLRRVFERAGHEVIEAENGAAALHAASTTPLDLVVTDIMMPVMNGVELIERLRRGPETAAIPILAVTGDWQLAARADAITPKPFREHELVALAARLLEADAEDLLDDEEAGSG